MLSENRISAVVGFIIIAFKIAFSDVSVAVFTTALSDKPPLRILPFKETVLTKGKDKASNKVLLDFIQSIYLRIMYIYKPFYSNQLFINYYFQITYFTLEITCLP